MIVHGSLNETDFLMYQLYVASTSERIRKKRQRSRILLPVLYAALGLYGFFNHDSLFALIFLAIGILWYFIYPVLEKRHYIRHYRNFIQDNYKDRLGRTTRLEFNNDYFLLSDSGSESKVLTQEVEEIVEIPSNIFVKLKGGQAIILSKATTENLNVLRAALKEMAAYLKIKYTDDTAWKWK